MFRWIKKLKPQLNNYYNPRLPNKHYDPRLELSVAVVGALISLQTGTDQNNIWNKVINAVSFAIITGSITFFIKLYNRLGDAVPTVDKLEVVLSKFDNLEMRLQPTQFFSNTMKAFHDQWIDWRESLIANGSIGELEEIAWKLLAEAYLGEEIKKIKERYVLTNTNRYTKLVAEVAKHLEKHHTSNGASHPQRIVRYHITGMLPEEFYNGSQIEFTANSSQPIFFCHKWEEYKDFYAQDYQGHGREQGSFQKSEIKRCIIVRQPNLHREEVSALSTLIDLHEQAKLSIIARERSVLDDLCNENDSVKKRLFRKCSPEHQQKYKNSFNTMFGRKNYRYWPIAHTEDCRKDSKKDCNNDTVWNDLLDVFSKDFHGNEPSDASFCVLNEDALNQIRSVSILQDCLKPGWIPEIVLFGRSGNGKGPEHWYFGILGHWRPFTPDIELRFLTSEQAHQLYIGFTVNVYQSSTTKGNLLDLKTWQDY